MKEIFIKGCSYTEWHTEEQKYIYTSYIQIQPMDELWEDAGFRIIKIL